MKRKKHHFKYINQINSIFIELYVPSAFFFLIKMLQIIQSFHLHKILKKKKLVVLINSKAKLNFKARIDLFLLLFFVSYSLFTFNWN